jgi:hypothetical protein
MTANYPVWSLTVPVARTLHREIARETRRAGAAR